MSLINEALKQARTQAPGTPPSAPPGIPVYSAPPPAPPPPAGGGFVGAVLVPLVVVAVLAGGGFLGYSYLKKSRTPAAETAAALPGPATAQAVPGQTPKMLEFYADWCGPCRTMKPVVEQFTKQYAGLVTVETVNVDANQELARKYNVTSIPLQVYLDPQGREVYRNVGITSAEAIARKWAELKLLPAAPAPQVAAAPPAAPRQPAVTDYGRAVEKAREAAALASARSRDTNAEMAADAVRPAAPAAATAVKPPPAASPGGYKLTGILGSGTSRMALINNQIVKVGDRVGNATVTAVTASGARLSEGGNTFDLPISR